MDESGTDEAECRRKVAGAIRFLVMLGVCQRVKSKKETEKRQMLTGRH